MDDEFETCPHNPAHRILRSRMQYHLVRCSRQHAKTTKRTCYFDTTHVVDEVEFESHLANCPSNGKIHMSRFVTEPQCSVGIPLEEVNNIQVPPSNEDWDKDQVPFNSYKPDEHIKDRNILRTSMIASKAQKKKYRQAERQRLQALSATPDNQNSAGVPPLPSNLDNKPIRPPRNIADAGPPIITRSSTKDVSLKNNAEDVIKHKNDPVKLYNMNGSHSKENQTLRIKETKNQVQSEQSFKQHCNESTHATNASETKLKEIPSNSLNKQMNSPSSVETTGQETQKMAEDIAVFAKLRLKINKSSTTIPTSSSIKSTNNENKTSKLLPPTGRGCSRLYQQVENLNLRPGMHQGKVPDIRKPKIPMSNGGYSSFIGYGSFDDSEISSDLNFDIENLNIK